MKTVIFPGFSLKNKDWALEVKNSWEGILPSEIIEWEHWKTNDTNFTKWSEWVERETPRALSQIGEGKVNIIAKSIGTLVAINILKLRPELINKLIICGIPFTDLQEEDKENYKVLANFPEDKLLCIQNENDNHGNFLEAKDFIYKINPKIKIISKPRDDHDYPYWEEFKEFLGR